MLMDRFPEYSIINIRGGSYEDIKKVLIEWADRNVFDMDNNLYLGICKNEGNGHIVKVDRVVPAKYFYDLVSCLCRSGKGGNIDVKGYIKPDCPEEINGKEVMVYMPPNDRKGNAVYAMTEEGRSFRIDSDGRAEEVAATENYSPVDRGSALAEEEMIGVGEMEMRRRRSEKRPGKPKLRFFFLTLITIFGFLMSWVVADSDPELAVWICYAASGIMLISLILDYKMLRNDKLYILLLILSLILLAYGLHFATFYTRQFEVDMIKISTKVPAIFLLIQKPARLVFKASVGREPIIDRVIGDFWYGMSLIILTILATILVYKIL